MPPEHEHETDRDRGIAHAEGQTVAQPQAHALSKEEIAKSRDLRRLYAAEYASMLRMYPDRELAKDVARVNVSALASAQPRIVAGEGRIAAEQAREALGRGDDLVVIRRAVAGVIERAAPALERARLPLLRGLDPER